MKKYKIGIQVSSYGDRCGIATYSERLCNALNNLKKDKDGNEVEVEAYQFINKPKKNTDIISLQFEPGLMPPPTMQHMTNTYSQPIVVTVHHIGYLPQMWGLVEGFHFHNVEQFEDYEEQPWNKRVIPHPALVYPNKDKMEIRKKLGLPLDKKIIGTFGFITGTGKNLPETVRHLLNNLSSDEFLYLGTAFWKGGDLGRKEAIEYVVSELGKENQFRLDSEFVSEEELNEKMQACDLLWAWCNVPKHGKGSQSGAVADMYGARRKLIVKDSAHYSFIGQQDKVLVGREDPKDFAIDVLNALRSEDLDDIQDPEWLSWENQAVEYLDFFQEVLGE